MKNSGTLQKAGFALLLATMATGSNAALVFDLNCIKTGTDACSVGPSVGSITLEQVTAGDIKVSVQSLIYDNSGGNLVKEVLLNIDPTLQSSVALVADIGNGNTVDGETLSPWSAAFDFESAGSILPTPITGNIAMFTISATQDGANFDLTEAMFNFANEIGSPKLFAAAHLQSCTGDLCPEGSLKVGAVPIPAAAWLFGSGLIGLAGIARKRKAS